MLKWKLVAATILTGVLVSNCGPKPTDPADLLWGHLVHGMYGRLINAQPNTQIATCGDHKEAALDAIKTWANAIGRTAHLTLTADCAPGAGFKLTVVGGAQGQQECRDRYQDSNLPGGFAELNRIVICQAMGERNVRGLLLHEVGHIWGMCDQYDPNILPGADNCDPNHKSSARVSNSVMGANYALTLPQDDVTGIQQLAARTDIEANGIWRRLLAGEVGSSEEQMGTQFEGNSGQNLGQDEADNPEEGNLGDSSGAAIGWFLGAKLNPTTVSGQPGLEVKSIVGNSPASRSELRVGDVISLVTLNEGGDVETGQGVATIADWDRVVGASTTGRLTLLLIRNGTLFPPAIALVQLTTQFPQTNPVNCAGEPFASANPRQETVRCKF